MFIRDAAFAVALFLVAAFPSTAQTEDKVEQAIDLIVTFCVAGGESVELETTGEVEGGVALRRLGVGAEAEIRFTRQESKGLVSGLRNAVGEHAAGQQSEARQCMQPYIDRILQVILGEPQTQAPVTRTIVRTQWFSSPRLEAKNLGAITGAYVTTCVRAPDGWKLRPATAHFDSFEFLYHAKGYDTQVPSNLEKSSETVVCGDLRVKSRSTILATVRATLRVQGERFDGLHFQ